MEKIKKVLIVEDEIAFQKSLEGELALQGVKVFVASDGLSGLEIAQKEHPDLIFLDVILPGIDGIAMLKKLRTDIWGKTATVVLLTQIDDLNRVAEALENGVSKYFIKANQSIPEIIKQTMEYVEGL